MISFRRGADGDFLDQRWDRSFLDLGQIIDAQRPTWHGRRQTVSIAAEGDERCAFLCRRLYRPILLANLIVMFLLGHLGSRLLAFVVSVSFPNSIGTKGDIEFGPAPPRGQSVRRSASCPTGCAAILAARGHLSTIPAKRDANTRPTWPVIG